MARSHKHVDFEVTDLSGNPHRFRTFDEAAGFAVSVSASFGGSVYIDVVVWSKAGARFYAGDDGVEEYEEDPEASVFDRLVVRADSQGRVA